jgi:hypothetical protein
LKTKKTVSKVRSAKHSRITKVIPKKHSSRQRPIHKRILLHPINVFFLLCVGVFIGGLTFHSFAASYTVTATVPAPLPVSDAPITSPSNQAHSTIQHITVYGSCPSNTYVELFLNGNMSGVASCGPTTTTYQLEIDLAAGSNSLFTKVFNVTDQEGPQSPTITVWYDLPLGTKPAAPGSATPNQSSIGTSLPFLIKTDFHYQVFRSGQPASWVITLSGGRGPYALTFIRGDGTQETFVLNNTAVFTLTHTYTSLKHAIATFIIKLQAVDSNGAKSYFQSVAIVKNQDIAVAATTSSDSASGLGAWMLVAQKWLWLAWPVYITAVLMTVSFWLGEKEEYVRLLRQRRAAKRRPLRRA